MRLSEIDTSGKVTFEVERTGDKQFVIGMYLNGKDIGTFGYTLVGDSSRNIAEVCPMRKGRGFGKLLLLKAIYTANELNIPFYEDGESLSLEQSHVYDSLDASQYIMRSEDDAWFVTEDGYDYLEAGTA